MPYLENITFYGTIKCHEYMFKRITSLKLIRYYSLRSVYSAMFNDMQTDGIVVYCCHRLHANFSGIVPIKGFECIDVPAKSCKVNYYLLSYSIFVFIPILI